MTEDRNAVTHIAFVLDRSGSMRPLRKVAIEGFNTQRKTLLAESGKPNTPDMTMTVCTFNTTFDFPFLLANPASVQELNDNLYNPSGGTALYDAVMETITRLERGTDTNDDYNSYLVVIISDGEENSSKLTKQNDLAEKIQTLQSTGRWTFTYLASNQDLGKISQELNIPVGNMATYSDTHVGTTDAFEFTAVKMSDFMIKAAVANRNTRLYKKTGGTMGKLSSLHSTCNFYGEAGITDITKAAKASDADPIV